MTSARSANRDLDRDAARLSAELDQYISAHLTRFLADGKRFGPGAFTFVPPVPENYAALGRDPDDPMAGWGFVIQRESDGQYFELDIEVDAHPLEAGAR